MSDDRKPLDPAALPRRLTRRLTRRGMLTAAVGLGLGAAARREAMPAPASAASPLDATLPGGSPGQAAAAAREAYETLTAAESDLLEAIVARLIPTDALGPGAIEARAVHYIDRALGAGLAGSRDAYRSGLAALDRYARLSRGKGFLELPATDQDSVLIDVESGAATGVGAGFVGSSAAFFALLLSHTHQGTFGDPYYGGNANGIGWDLVGYPGVRTAVSRADQAQLESRTLPVLRRSAYDDAAFTKASARAGDPHDDRHGHDD